MPPTEVVLIVNVELLKLNIICAVTCGEDDEWRLISKHLPVLNISPCVSQSEYC